MKMKLIKSSFTLVIVSVFFLTLTLNLGWGKKSIFNIGADSYAQSEVGTGYYHTSSIVMCYTGYELFPLIPAVCCCTYKSKTDDCHPYRTRAQGCADFCNDCT